MDAAQHPGTAYSLPSEESIKQLFVESEMTTKLIYAFPKRLVECFRTVKKGAAKSLLNPKSVEQELALSKLTDINSYVAFRQELLPAPISLVNFRFLGEPPSPITPEILKLAGSKKPVEAAKGNTPGGLGGVC